MKSSRQPGQILAIPYVLTARNGALFATLRRADMNVWQGVAGGIESDESALQAAHRECLEELGTQNFSILSLDSRASIPASFFSSWSDWKLENPNLLVIPEYSFAVRLFSQEDVSLSSEHQTIEWHTYSDAFNLYKWDSNRTALWELDQRLRHRPLL